MVTLCLAGPEAERKFRCSINDGSDRVDYEMAREYEPPAHYQPRIPALALFERWPLQRAQTIVIAGVRKCSQTRTSDVG
jgi:hypothetical protein